MQRKPRQRVFGIWEMPSQKQVVVGMEVGAVGTELTAVAS